jgi:hypothetical protein
MTLKLILEEPRSSSLRSMAAEQRPSVNTNRFVRGSEWVAGIAIAVIAAALAIGYVA